MKNDYVSSFCNVSVSLYVCLYSRGELVIEFICHVSLCVSFSGIVYMSECKCVSEINGRFLTKMFLEIKVRGPLELQKARGPVPRHPRHTPKTASDKNR